VELDSALDFLKTETVASSSSSSSENNNSDSSNNSDEANEEIVTAEEKLQDEMGGVLWRLVYLRREEVEVDHVLELVK